MPDKPDPPLEVEVADIKARLNAIRELIDERARSIRAESDKADAALDARLETMNEFRDQLNRERATFVTRSVLDLIIKPLEDELEALERDRVSAKQHEQLITRVEGVEKKVNYNQGRDNTVYTIIAITVSLVSSAIAVIALIFR